MNTQLILCGVQRMNYVYSDIENSFKQNSNSRKHRINIFTYRTSLTDNHILYWYLIIKCYYNKQINSPMIPYTQHDTKQHVNNSKDDGYLHFVGIIEVDLVGGNLPHGIQAKGIWILRVLSFVSGVQGYFLRHQR